MNDDTRSGAEAFIQLMRDVGALSEASLQAEGLDLPFCKGPDARDYVGMSCLVDAALRRLELETSADYRQGFARAMAELLCINFDGCGVTPDGWDPLQSSEPAFCAPRLAASAISSARRYRP